MGIVPCERSGLSTQNREKDHSHLRQPKVDRDEKAFELLRDSNDNINHSCDLFWGAQKQAKIPYIGSIILKDSSVSMFWRWHCTHSESVWFSMSKEIMEKFVFKRTTFSVDSHLCTRTLISWEKIGCFSVLGAIRIFWGIHTFLRQVCVFRRIFSKTQGKGRR